MNLDDLKDYPMYYHMDGTPYTGTRHEQTLAWGRDFENRLTNGGVIGRDTLWNGIWVSTMWMGLDHNFGGGRPLIFESMAFEGPGPRSQDLDQDRYSTLEEAKAGHAAMVKKFSHWTWVYIIFWRKLMRRAEEAFQWLRGWRSRSKKSNPEDA